MRTEIAFSWEKDVKLEPWVEKLVEGVMKEHPELTYEQAVWLSFELISLKQGIENLSE